jgi:hypothetical protein
MWAALLSLVMVGGSSLVLACGVPAKTVVDVGLSVEQAICVLTEAELGDETPEVVEKVCLIDPSLVKEIESLLLERKKAKEAAAAKLAANAVKK